MKGLSKRLLLKVAIRSSFNDAIECSAKQAICRLLVIHSRLDLKQHLLARKVTNIYKSMPRVSSYQHVGSTILVLCQFVEIFCTLLAVYTFDRLAFISRVSII